MHYAPYEQPSCFRRYAFRSFVCVVLSMLLGLHLQSHFWVPPDGIERDFTDIKDVITQLSYGLTEINRKHEKLQGEIERISETLPAVAAAAGRARDALEPSRMSRHSLNVHDYDRQIVDYALETAGAKVVDTGNTIEYMIHESPVSWALHILVASFCRECLGAASIIRPGTLPGECWAFKGTKGEATIRLLSTIYVTGISLEHIPPHISPTKEISSAPRLFQLEGLEFRNDPYPYDFGSFEYDKDAKPIQYFEVRHPSSKGFNLVRIRIFSNWGHTVYTCVYRVRVHGELVRKPLNSIRDDGDNLVELE
ncbi:unnamed protein product [Pieris macdunnoughi]|uniref:SUN domain-containing protein n=1 Tax=Pieris macdunnoughi TaxID=345717 RepID=A0A821YAA2_9NEOP|nr:unnamed protein product [Pieris macdunnoughi]